MWGKGAALPYEKKKKGRHIIYMTTQLGSFLQINALNNNGAKGGRLVTGSGAVGRRLPTVPPKRPSAVCVPLSLLFYGYGEVFLFLKKLVASGDIP